VLIKREFLSRDENGKTLMLSSTLSLSIKDNVEDLTQMFQRHSTGEHGTILRSALVC
jgi:hypothetical protein